MYIKGRRGLGIVFKEVEQPRGTTIMKLLDERFSEAPLTFLRTTKVGVVRVVFCLGVLVRVAGYGGTLCGGVLTRRSDFCFLSFLSFPFDFGRANSTTLQH